MEFKYQFNESEDPEAFGGSLCIKRNPTESEQILIKADEKGEVSILANRIGWEFLAKICIEMSHLASRDPFFHSHRTEEFQLSLNAGQDKVIFAQIKKD